MSRNAATLAAQLSATAQAELLKQSIQPPRDLAKKLTNSSQDDLKGATHEQYECIYFEKMLNWRYDIKQAILGKEPAHNPLQEAWVYRQIDPTSLFARNLEVFKSAYPERKVADIGVSEKPLLVGTRFDSVAEMLNSLRSIWSQIVGDGHQRCVKRYIQEIEVRGSQAGRPLKYPDCTSLAKAAQSAFDTLQNVADKVSERDQVDAIFETLPLSAKNILSAMENVVTGEEAKTFPTNSYKILLKNKVMFHFYKKKH